MVVYAGCAANFDSALVQSGQRENKVVQLHMRENGAGKGVLWTAEVMPEGTDSKVAVFVGRTGHVGSAERRMPWR